MLGDVPTLQRRLRRTVDQDLAEDLLEAATATIVEMMGQPWERDIRTLTLDGRGRRSLLLPHWPVHDVADVTVDDVPVDVDWSSSGWIVRKSGVFPDRPRSVVAVVDAGWQQPPTALVNVALSMAARAYSNPEQLVTVTLDGRQIRYQPDGPTAIEQAIIARHAVR